MEKAKKFIVKNFVPITFLVLCLLGIMLSNVSVNFLGAELYKRVMRNTIMMLALLVPIMAGMGINFSIVIGALCSQFATVIIIDRKIEGITGFIAVIIISLIMAYICGNIIGYILNRSKGREMITSLVIGLLGTSIYNLIFMAGYGTIITPNNDKIMLSSGIGVQSMIDLKPMKAIILEYPLIPIVFIILVTLIIKYIVGTKLGSKLKAVGSNMQNAYSLGIDVDKSRKQAIIISTMIASVGHLMFIFDIGSLNVYTGHLNVDVFACAALLAGGATLNKANLKNVFVGVVLFHTLFIVSPLAGKALFENAAIGEYFRSFIAYSTIVFSLMINIHNEKKEKIYTQQVHLQ
ncbi:ABC transporter permease subunit [Romboutsia weinsteinii]|nr:ABC transporter permease [Romboutsia weinsteinii]